MAEYKVNPQIIDGYLVARLPAELSRMLPSRGMVFGEGELNGRKIKVPLEPDGRGGHWFMIDTDVKKTTNIPAGHSAKLRLVPTDDWPDPDMPQDIMSAFMADPISREMWRKITPKARWEWLRWIRSTNNADTRAKRIQVSISKMHKGMRRPCCFNQSMCTVPQVSKSGVLIAL